MQLWTAQVKCEFQGASYFNRITFQVAPSELEDLIRQHEGVLEVAVTGIPDERAGEMPRAYVIRKNRKVLEQDIMK